MKRVLLALDTTIYDLVAPAATILLNVLGVAHAGDVGPEFRWWGWIVKKWAVT